MIYSPALIRYLANMDEAATDSTAALISNVIFCLSRAPTTLARLREEIAVLNDQPPDFVTLQRFKYLHGVIQEGM